MKREDVTKVFEGATDEQINAILNINSADIGKAKGDYDTLKSSLEAANGTISTLKTEVQTLKDSNADAEDWKKKFEDLDKKVKDDEKAAAAEKAKAEKEADILNRYRAIVRNVGVINICGKEAWKTDASRNNDTTLYFYSNAVSSTIADGLNINSINGLCDNMEMETIVNVYSINTTKSCISCASGTNGLRLRIEKSRLNDESTEALNEWLSANPLNLYYPIQLTEEKVNDLPKITIGKNTNIITAGTDILPSDMEVTYYADKEG